MRTLEGMLSGRHGRLSGPMAFHTPTAPRRVARLEGPAGFETWRDRLSALFDVSLSPETDASTFVMETVTWQLSTAIVSQAVSSTRQRLRRDMERITRRPADLVALYVCDGGRLRVEHERGVSELEAGDMLFSDYTQPSTSDTTDFANVSLILDRSRVPAVFRDASLHGSVLHRDNAATRVIAAFARAICDHLDDMAVSDGDLALQALIELAADVWSRDVGRGDRLKESDRLNDRAIVVIKDELENRALSAALIADRLGISRTQLFDLFKERGGVRPAISSLRLDHAFQALLVEPDRRGTVSAIAFRFGFKSEAHFSRAFVRRFGRTPSKVLSTRESDKQALVHGSQMSGQGREAKAEGSAPDEYPAVTD